jgi:hypothetical protein
VECPRRKIAVLLSYLFETQQTMYYFPSFITLLTYLKATTSNWVFNFIIGMVSPDAFAGIGGYFYLVIAGFCLCSAAGHSLEEIAVAFGDKAFADSDEEIMDNATVGDEKTHFNA